MAKLKNVMIQARADDGYTVEVASGGRVFYVDQSPTIGGRGLGPSPMEYLFSAIAGCLATTARIIAIQKNLSLGGMNIKIEGALDTAFIYGKTTEGRPGVTGIDVTVELDSEMPEDERNNFLEEVRFRCPVLDTVAAVTPVSIAAAREASEG